MENNEEEVGKEERNVIEKRNDNIMHLYEL